MSWDLLFRIIFLLCICIGITTDCIKHKISLIRVLLYINLILFTLDSFFNLFEVNIIIFITTIFIVVLFINKLFNKWFK
jgi:hypothetical protein